MSFAYTTDKQDTIGSMRAIYGTYTATSATSGTIATSLGKIVMFTVDASTSSALLPQSTITAGSVALAGLTSSQAGHWMAIGY